MCRALHQIVGAQFSRLPRRRLVARRRVRVGIEIHVKQRRVASVSVTIEKSHSSSVIRNVASVNRTDLLGAVPAGWWNERSSVVETRTFARVDLPAKAHSSDAKIQPMRQPLLMALVHVVECRLLHVRHDAVGLSMLIDI